MPNMLYRIQIQNISINRNKGKMMKPYLKNGFILKKDSQIGLTTIKYELPTIQPSSLMINAYQRSYYHNSFHRKLKVFNKKNEKSKSVKRDLPSQLQKKLKDKEKENQMKMERSISRFIQKEHYFNKTCMQKKKQKKFFGMENLQNQQINFFKSAARDNLMKQQIADDDSLNRELPLNILPNICYDSAFMLQREGSCLTILNNKVYLFGGALRRKTLYQSDDSNNKSNNDILFHSYEDGKWVQQPIQNQVSADKKNLIHHTVNSIGKKFIVIAGGMVGDSHKTLSKFNDSILLYNVQTKKLQQTQCSFRTRSHASTSFQNNIILHGGINDGGYITGEIYILTVNMFNQNTPVKISRYQTNESLAHHQIVSTLGEDKNFKINLRENNGIYMFGGEDANGNMCDRLKIMKIYSISDLEKKGVKNFEEIKTRGEGPCSRTNHSMNLISKKNSLVIIGGLDSNTNPLSDVWIIQLCHLSWRRIQTCPNIDIFLGGIYKHATTFNSSSIFILGGRYLKDVGKDNFMRLDFKIDIYDLTRSKQRKHSKLSSCWSIGHQAGQSDKILFND